MSERRFSDRIVMVTGAARGLGESHARMFAAEGATVILADILREDGERLRDELGDKGHRATFIELDVADASSWERAVERVSADYGHPDVLINNAGVGGPYGLDVSTADWHSTIAVNQSGIFFGMRAVVPGMRTLGRGAIVNVSSVLGHAGDAGYLAYSASKGAVLAMTRSAAVQLAAAGIRVNSVSPGFANTPMSGETTPEGDEIHGVADGVAATPMKRLADPSEISSAVVFLASDAASYITGTDLAVDGGYLAQ